MSPNGASPFKQMGRPPSNDMSRITITILGTTAGVPTRERAHTAIHLNYDDGEQFNYLFDCGEGAQRQMMIAGLNIMKLEGVFITHWHGDHCLGLPGMVDTMGFESRERPLDIFAPEAKRIKKALSVTYSMGNFKIIPHDVPLRGEKEFKVLDEERFSIISLPMKHSVPTVAYALVEKNKTQIDLKKATALGLPEKGEIYNEIKTRGMASFEGRKIALEDISSTRKGKRFVFSGDTEVSENLKKLVRDADLLVQDCTYFEDLKDKPHQHATLPEVLDMVEKENVKKTVLTHISRKYQDPEELERLVSNYPNVGVAKDFKRIEI